MRLSGKVIIVTGAARGLGQAYAAHLASEGAKVIGCDVKDCTQTAELVEKIGGEILTLKTDVTSEADTTSMAEQTVKRFGRIDGIVNNAAIYDGLVTKPILEVDLDEWDRVMAVNVKGVFLCCRAVFPQMKKQGKGKMINIASDILSSALPGVPHYVASKIAVLGLTRTLARELGEYNITVNAVAPGYTLTEASLAFDKNKRLPMAAPLPEIVRQKRCLHRDQKPQDMTGTIAFLCSDDSDFITGQLITVNGGSTLY